MAYISRLKKEYGERIIAALTEEFGYKNVMQVPKLEKIVFSRGVGAAVADKKLVDHAVEELTTISGQKDLRTRFYYLKHPKVLTIVLNKYQREKNLNRLKFQTRILRLKTEVF